MSPTRVAPDLGIPEVKPAIESIRGRWEQKVSPRLRHAIVQARLAAYFLQWAGDRGQAGTELRCYLLPYGEEPPSSLVPDLAYFSFERLPRELGDLREKPTVAPDVAIEIISLDDRRSVLDEKIALYTEFGSLLVVVVDPHEFTIEMHEGGERIVFRSGEIAVSKRFPDLRIETEPLLEGL